MMFLYLTPMLFLGIKSILEIRELHYLLSTENCPILKNKFRYHFGRKIAKTLLISLIPILNIYYSFRIIKDSLVGSMFCVGMRIF